MDEVIKHFSNVVNSDQFDNYKFELPCKKEIYFFGIVARKRPNESTWSSKFKQYEKSIMHLRDRLED